MSMIAVVSVGAMNATNQSGAMQAVGTPMAQTRDRWFNDDFVVMSDAVQIGFAPLILDLAVLDDEVTLDFTKAPFTDTVSLTDNATVSVGFIRQFDDTVTMTDALQPFALGKGIADIVTLDDLISVNGQNSPNDVATMSDQAVIGFAPGTKADTVSVSDAGKVIAQNYFATGDYFADDYFGTSRTF